MVAKLRILATAEADIDEAFKWYEQRQAGLGSEFMRAVDARIRAIQRNPDMSGFVERHYRRALVRRFPFAILYAYVNDIVTVYAVFHTSQDCGLACLDRQSPVHSQTIVKSLIVAIFRRGQFQILVRLARLSLLASV